MKVLFCIDWLNYTVGSTVTSRHVTGMAYQSMHQVFARPMHGYQNAIVNQYGARVMWSPDDARMGIHIMYPGSVLNEYRVAAIPTSAIMQHHATFNDICKRIDVAIDILGSKLSIFKLYGELKRRKAACHAGNYALITGNAGDTLYIGSRQSDLFCRIYDKGAQQHVDDDWKRIELEIKGGRAIETHRLLAFLPEDEMAVSARGMIRGFVQFRDKTYRKALADEPIEIGVAHDERRETRQWLLFSVAPALAHFAALPGNADIMADFTTAVSREMAGSNSDELFARMST